MRLLLAALVALSFAALAPAASPSLGIIAPAGAQRGTEAKLDFQGARLADTQEVLVTRPGITVKKFEVVNPNLVRVTAEIAADCALGEHSFRLRTASGVSDLRTFWVGALPAVQEVEPNGEFDKPQAIALNSTVYGTITGEDVDYFVVECKKGQRLAVEVEGMRLGTQFWDPFVAILDSRRFELATNDDSALLGQDSGCAVVIPADGKYVVQLRDASYGGNGNCRYRLHVGTFPRPTAVVPAGGKPGDEVEVRFLGDPAGEIKQKVKLPATADADFRLHCQTADGVSPTGFKFRLSPLANFVDTPAASAPAGAVVATVPGAFNGVVSKAEEAKYFRFAGKKGQVFDIHCHARKLGSILDPVLHVCVANGPALGGEIAANDDSRGPDSYVRVTLPQDGDYFVWVHDHLRKGGVDYFFRVEVTPVVPATTTTLPKVNGNDISNQERQTVSVPKGGRTATLVTVTRADWGGAGTVAVPGLPAGVTLKADALDAGQSSVPVVFEAAPDAAIGGTLTPVTVKPADDKLAVPCQTELDVNFNMGINNTPFHRYYTDRVAVVVTEAAPYSVEVVEPKVPLAQNGAAQLKIVVKRSATFKGPVTVTPLFSPPGIGIQGSVTIPPDKSEGFLSLNAAGNAAPRSWKTAVIASADAGQGTVWTSSQLFTLTVSKPYLALAQDRAAVEQGKTTQVVCKLQVATPFDGPATAQLLGLPAKATVKEITFNKDAKEIVFEVATDKTTPAGKHRVFCQVTVPDRGETVVHSLGGNELRVDVPLPPKVVAAAPPVVAPKVEAKPAEKPAEKRLSRLEQLRLEQDERDKAARGEKPAEKKP